MVLLGSIQRYELERMLLVHLSYDQTFTTDVLDDLESGRSSPSMASLAVMPDSDLPPRPRFVVTKVDDPPPVPPSNGNDIQLNMLKVVGSWGVPTGTVCKSVLSELQLSQG